MTRVALLSYFISGRTIRVFLIQPDAPHPLTFDTLIAPDELRSCLQRMLIDFHGIEDYDWPEHEGGDLIKGALQLDPPVNSAKRIQNISRERIKKSDLHYQLSYWESLSDRLLPSGLRAEIEDCDLLCISPQGPLHGLPFSALRWSKDQYLIERFGICNINSVDVLRYCKSRNRMRNSDHAPTSYMIAAVAAAEDHDPESLESDGQLLAMLFRGRYPDSKVTCLVGPEPVEGRKPASKSEIQRNIANHDVVHLACHGFFGGRVGASDPLESGLLVSDGQSRPTLRDESRGSANGFPKHCLTVREIFNLRLIADLVTLRACSSGRAQIRSGDELVGLVRSFLYAGTPSLLVSLWNVDKISSQLLLNEFYSRWLNQELALPKWRALQLAQQKLLKSQEYQHPYHWAPFVLVGDWV
jgi:CHAT domain-containing protein